MKKTEMYYLYILIGLGLLYTTVLVMIPKSDYWIDLPVWKLGTLEKVSQFKNATLQNSKVLSLDNPDLLQRLFAPNFGEWYDPIYVYYTMALAVFLLIYFKGYNLITDGFTPKALKGVKALMFTSFIFLILHLIRDYWIFHLVKEITSGEYKFRIRSFTYNPELYIAIILGKLMMVFKRGIQIDQEQQLTI